MSSWKGKANQISMLAMQTARLPYTVCLKNMNIGKLKTRYQIVEVIFHWRSRSGYHNLNAKISHATLLLGLIKFNMVIKGN
jgi:hypothetical protein